jgi:hypothetical protein
VATNHSRRKSSNSNSSKESTGKNNGLLPRLLLRKKFPRATKSGVKGSRLRESLSLADYEFIFGHGGKDPAGVQPRGILAGKNCSSSTYSGTSSLPSSPTRVKLVKVVGMSRRRGSPSKGFSWPPGTRWPGRGNELGGGKRASSVQRLDSEAKVPLRVFRELFPSQLLHHLPSSSVGEN